MQPTPPPKTGGYDHDSSSGSAVGGGGSRLNYPASTGGTPAATANTTRRGSVAPTKDGTQRNTNDSSSTKRKGGAAVTGYNAGAVKLTAKELIAERARIDQAMEQVDAAKAKARAQRAEYGRYLKWKVDLQHKERKSREQEDVAMRKEVEDKLKLVLAQHREQAKEDRNQWGKFSKTKVRKQEPLWLANGLEKERQFVQQQQSQRREHIDQSTEAFRETVPRSAPAGHGGSVRKAPPHHLPKLAGGVDDGAYLGSSVNTTTGAAAPGSPGGKRSGDVEYFTDPDELHDPHRPLRRFDDERGAWAEQRRAADNRLYFLNRKTKEKTWDVMDTPFATMPFIDPNAIDLSRATDEESIRQLRDQRLKDPNRPLRKIGRWLEKRRPTDNLLYFLNYENKTTTTKVDESPFGKMAFEDYTAEESLKEIEKEKKEKAKFFDPNRPLRTCPHWHEERDEEGGHIIFVNEKKITKNVDETPFAFLSLDDGVKKLTAAEKIMQQSKQTGALDMPAVFSLMPPMHDENERANNDRRMLDGDGPGSTVALRAAQLQKQSRRHFAAVQDMFTKAQTRSLYARGRMQADPPADYMLGTDILRYIPAEVLAKEDDHFGQDDGGMALLGDNPNKNADTVFLTATDGLSPGRTQETDLGGDVLSKHQGSRDEKLNTNNNGTTSAPARNTKWKKWNPDAWMALPEASTLALKQHREPEEEAATLTWYKSYHEQYTRVHNRTEYHGKNYAWKRAEKHNLPVAKNIAHDKD